MKLKRILSWLTLRNLKFEHWAVQKAAADLRRSIRKLDRRRKRLAADAHRLGMISKTIAEDLRLGGDEIADALANQTAYETAMEAMSTKLEIMEKVAIPALIEYHNQQHERLKAETALQIGRQVQAIPRED